jgi:hypothetical protein
MGKHQTRGCSKDSKFRVNLVVTNSTATPEDISLFFGHDGGHCCW